MTIRDTYRIDDLLRVDKFKLALKLIKKHYTKKDLLTYDGVSFIDTCDYRVYLLDDFSDILDIESLTN